MHTAFSLQNWSALCLHEGMDTAVTRYGTLTGISTCSSYPDGSLRTAILHEENRLQTHVGDLIPQYRVIPQGERQRKHRSSVEFYEDGQLRSASLDLAMPIQTPLGTIKGELVTFYEDGSLKRFFPLNGQVDGYWSERNEGELAELLDFDLPVGKFRAKIINLFFYRSGALKSLTLWPGQVVTIRTPLGPMLVRTGFSLYEDGALRSAEPASAVELPTPIGSIKAFDAEMVGMNADLNSVQFTPDGRLRSVKTIHTGLRVLSGGAESVIEPLETSSLINLNGLRTVPMRIDFEDQEIGVVARDTDRFDTRVHRFIPFERIRVIRDSCGSACPESKCPTCDGGPSCCKNQSQ